MITSIPSLIASGFVSAELKDLLLTSLVLVLVLCVIGGLYLLIEKFWGPFPPMVRLIFGIVMLIIVIIWAIVRFL